MGMDSNSGERSFKEQRIREITFIYYSRSDVRKAIFDFSLKREIVPRYFEGFGKRPDNFQYEGDMLEQVKRGATSFHCSEELWSDALEISNEFNRGEFDELRVGWDLLLDIDSPYLDYSKIYAEILINVLRFHGIENIGVKFSVSGDTDILIKNNDKIQLTRIDNAINLMKKGERLEVLSLDKQKKIKFSKIYDYLEHKDILYEISHSQSKIPIKATGHHSVFVWDKGEIIQKKVDELSKGDFLISYNCDNNPFSKEIKTIPFEYEFSKKLFNENIEITPELMRLIGYFLAEGHTTGSINQTGFTFNINEKKYIEDCKNLLFNLTERKISIRHPNSGSTQILIHSKKWHDFFKKFCGEKKDKHIPDFSWTLPKDLFLEMLKGYIYGDGYKLGEYGIVIKSVSKRLIKEFVWLCKLHGISCSLSSEQGKPHTMPQGNIFKGSFVYIIKIPKSELDSLEFFRDRNKFSPYPRDRVFPIDGLKVVYNKIKPGMFNYHRPEQMTLKKKRANLKRIRKVLDWFSKYKTVEEDEECKKIINNYETLFNSDTSVVEIRAIIKKGEEKVYDVSVEETESFFGNDYPVLLHNSGSKGFHIIVPWKAFPEEIYGRKTSDMFPEWPRLICGYLESIIQPKLAERILHDESLKDIAEKTGKSEEDLIVRECVSCHRPAVKKSLITWVCPACKNEINAEEGMYNNRRKSKCPNPDCRQELFEKSRKDIFQCEFCEVSSQKNPELFEEKERFATEKLIEADLILVAPRHLFRMPYSLHEKTALSSVVIDKDKIKDFQITDANALKVKVKDFYPSAQKNEARDLLLQSLDWKEQKDQEENIVEIQKKNARKGDSLDVKPKGDYKQVIIPDPSEELYSPQIKLLLEGVKQDGRKRALFILLGFFKSLGVDEDGIEKRIYEWNEKNYNPLKKGYVQSQLNWYRRMPVRMPPNFNNPIYKDLGVDKHDELSKQVKNPVAYSVKMFFKKKFTK
jgi:hypothetical protein